MRKLAKASTEAAERNLTNRKKKVFMAWVLFAKCLTANSLQTTPTPRPPPLSMSSNYVCPFSPDIDGGADQSNEMSNEIGNYI